MRWVPDQDEVPGWPVAMVIGVTAPHDWLDNHGGYTANQRAAVPISLLWARAVHDPRPVGPGIGRSLGALGGPGFWLDGR